MDRDLLERLFAAANGGRVASSGFLTPTDSSELAAALRGRGVAVSVGGGFPAALRRVVSAHPQHIPEALPPFAAVTFDGRSADEVGRLLRSSNVADTAVGDLVTHQDGVSLMLLAPPAEALLTAAAGGVVVAIERVAGGSRRHLQVIVPSLRVDALGAKAFRVSRTYFARGISGGNVYLNGQRVGKGGSAVAGDEIFADGLGWLRLTAVDGETKRGNLRVVVEVERRG